MTRTFAGAVALLIGCVAIAQGPVIPAPTITKGANELPVPSKGSSALDNLKNSRSELKNEREGTSKTTDSDETASDVERREMRKRLDVLLKQLDNRSKLPPETKPIPKAPVPGIIQDPKGSSGGADVPEISSRTEALLLAQNLYKSGDYGSALSAFRIIDLSKYAPEDRAFIQYMTASCLRRTGKLSEAASLYRDVASAKDDDFVTECALWQLGSLRTREEMEKQLAQLRQRREAMTPK
jgi:hypothetical protein